MCSSGNRQATHVVLPQVHQHSDSLEPHGWTRRRQQARSLVHLERLPLHLELLQNRPHAADEHSVRRVEVRRPAEVVLRQSILSSLHVDIAQPEPGVVVPNFAPDSLPEEVGSCIPLLHRDALVPCKGVSVCETGIALQGPLEALERVRVILEVGEDVSGRYPRLGESRREGL